MHPRIYTYKITFEAMPYWYWGVHKEKKYDEAYFGSPTTNKWYWDFYEPRIQILEFFPYTDSGWADARKVEQRLIRPDLNHPYCLNERCGGTVSLAVARKSGNLAVTNQTGIHDPAYKSTGRYIEYRRDNCLRLMGEGRGIFEEGYLGSERHREDSRSGGIKTYREKMGVFAEYLGSERHIENAQESGRKCFAEKLGAFSAEGEEKRIAAVSRKVEVQSEDGATKIFRSISKAAEELGLNPKTVKKMADTGCEGKIKRTQGMKVSYIE